MIDTLFKQFQMLSVGYFKCQPMKILHERHQIGKFF